MILILILILWQLLIQLLLQFLILMATLTLILKLMLKLTLLRLLVAHPQAVMVEETVCLLYTSPSPRDRSISRMPSSA